MKLQELVLFCWCRSLKLPKTQPVSWPKCWNCEPKIVSILITCAFWKFHLHSCAVYVILHDTSIYFWYLMFFGCIGPSLIAASHKQQTGNQISWCFSTLLGNISHQITALPHCHQTQKQDSIQLVVRVALFVRTARDQHLFTSKSAPLVDAASLIMVSDVVLHSVCTLYSRSEYFASKKSPFFFVSPCFTEAEAVVKLMLEVNLGDILAVSTIGHVLHVLWPEDLWFARHLSASQTLRLCSSIEVNFSLRQEIFVVVRRFQCTVYKATRSSTTMFGCRSFGAFEWLSPTRVRT